MPRTKKQAAPVVTKEEFEELQEGKPVTLAAPADVPDSADFPPLTVCIITYQRLKEIRQTIDALLKHLVYPKDKLRWLIADDHSGDGYTDEIINTPRYQSVKFEASITEKNCGWGCNTNKALSNVETDYVFQLEDNKVLTSSIDLRVGVALLQVKPEIGMLRYRGTAGDHVVLHQLEADIKDYLPDYQDGTGLPGKLTYCLLDNGSPTAYVYSNGAHLKRKSFHSPENYGAYPEGYKLGHTEEAFAVTTKERMRLPNAPAIAILPDYIKNVWNYIGTSYQLTEHDKGI